MIRILDITRLVFNILRASYSISFSNVGVPSLNVIYRYLCTCFYPVLDLIDHYESVSRKDFTLASNDGSQVSALGYLNAIYGGYGAISIVIQTPAVYLYPYDDSTFTNLYPYEVGTFLSLYPYNSGTNSISIRIPATLASDDNLYPDFLSDLNALIMYGIQYQIITY